MARYTRRKSHYSRPRRNTTRQTKYLMRTVSACPDCGFWKFLEFAHTGEWICTKCFAKKPSFWTLFVERLIEAL